MDYEKKLKRITAATKALHRMIGAVLLLALVFVGSTVYDMYAFTEAGRGTSFPGFKDLLSQNKDTVAWLKMDGTHIDHPVVQGKDNFEYINKGFDGKFYQGGSIFLDEGNAKDFTDQYIIIHGHHMARGAMFGDVAAYLDKTFFEDNTSGQLITPGAVYELTVCGAGIADAYDGAVYYTAPEVKVQLKFLDKCTLKRKVDFKNGDKLVMLSTCAGDMTTKRAVVFCRARMED